MIRLKVSTRIVALTIALSFFVLLCGGIALIEIKKINHLFYETVHHKWPLLENKGEITEHLLELELLGERIYLLSELGHTQKVSQLKQEFQRLSNHLAEHFNTVQREIDAIPVNAKTVRK